MFPYLSNANFIIFHEILFSKLNNKTHTKYLLKFQGAIDSQTFYNNVSGKVRRQNTHIKLPNFTSKPT